MPDMKKILLVEDEDICAKPVELFMKAAGAEMVHVKSGEAALEQCDTETFNLIVMDLGLGANQIDGFETTEKVLSSSKQNLDTPIVALTARKTEEDQQHCLDVGMKKMYIKPVSLPMVKEMLAEYAK